MSAHLFRVEEHTVPCQHIREYPRATADQQEDVLHLAVKQYIPLDNPEPRPGDVTIIGAHANGFPKELYEPLWDDIYTRSKQEGFRIRSVWIADIASQGDSGVLNEHLLGNEPGWHDHARDLLHLINTKRALMPRPIVGIGHSFGGNNLTYLSFMHPRLIATLVLLDPVILAMKIPVPPNAFSALKMSARRRDIWPSLDDAVETFKKSTFFASWDPRVLHRWVQFGFRRLPTLIYPETGAEDNRVTLKTTKHQEVFTFARPNFKAFRSGQFDPKHHVDLEREAAAITPFIRAEGNDVYRRLESVRPSVLYVFGENSELSAPEERRAKICLTGAGVGGSGGIKAGRVKEVVLAGVGHLVAMEAVGRCAESAAAWIGAELKRWKADEEEFQKAWACKSIIEKSTIDDEWREMMGTPPGTGRGRSQTKL